MIAVAVVIVLLQFMQAILVPFVISGLLFYALDPGVDWLQRIKVPRVLGSAAMLGVAVAVIAALAFSLQGQAMTVVNGVLERIRRGEQVDHYQTKRRRKDGTVIDVSVRTPSTFRRPSSLAYTASCRKRSPTSQDTRAPRQ